MLKTQCTLIITDLDSDNSGIRRLKKDQAYYVACKAIILSCLVVWSLYTVSIGHVTMYIHSSFHSSMYTATWCSRCLIEDSIFTKRWRSYVWVIKATDLIQLHVYLQSLRSLLQDRPKSQFRHAPLVVTYYHHFLFSYSYILRVHANIEHV